MAIGLALHHEITHFEALCVCVWGGGVLGVTMPRARGLFKVYTPTGFPKFQTHVGSTQAPGKAATDTQYDRGVTEIRHAVTLLVFGGSCWVVRLQHVCQLDDGRVNVV
jgi:hypothetical protein